MPKEAKMPKETSRGSGSSEIKLHRRGRRRARPADCGYPCLKPEASSARRETILQREIAVKNVSLGIFDPSLGIFDPARCRRNPDFLGGFPPKPRSVLRNRQGIPRLSGVSSRARGCNPLPAAVRAGGAWCDGML